MASPPGPASSRTPPPPGAPKSAAPQAPNPLRSRRFWITLLVLLAANLFITNVLLAPAQPTTITLPYNLFKQQLAADNIVTVTTTGDAITGVTKTQVQEPGTGTKATHFTTQRPSFADDGLESLLEQHGVTINAKPENPPLPFWEQLLLSFGPTLLIVLGLLYLLRRSAAAGAGGLLGSFGQSRARIYDAERPAPTFADVAGIDEDKQEQTLNQILTEMDGFEPGTGVIVLSATNRAEILDPALTRPGRFDRRVTLQPPDRRGRAAILKIHAAGVPLGPDVDLDDIAGRTPGLVGADLRNLVNEAALGAARKAETVVTAADFYEAIDRILLGTERHLMLTQADRERIAYHESGHALLGLLVAGADPVRKVTIIPHGGALGVTIQSPIDDRFNYGEDYLRARIIGALGGRAAEHLVYGVVSTGAANDLQQVTLIAREMVVRWGMSSKIGPLAFAEDGQTNSVSMVRPYSEATAREVDLEIKRIADECFAEAMRLLTENRNRLDALARALLAEDSLGEDKILSVTGLKRVQVAGDEAGPRSSAGGLTLTR